MAKSKPVEPVTEAREPVPDVEIPRYVHKEGLSIKVCTREEFESAWDDGWTLVPEA